MILMMNNNNFTKLLQISIFLSKTIKLAKKISIYIQVMIYNIPTLYCKRKYAIQTQNVLGLCPVIFIRSRNYWHNFVLVTSNKIAIVNKVFLLTFFNMNLDYFHLWIDVDALKRCILSMINIVSLSLLTQ